jgi:hypothetical protein
MKIGKVAIAFVVVQLVGIACSWFSQHPYSAASSFLWGTGLLALLPGNLLGTWAVESLFWRSGLTLGIMSVVGLALAVAINAVVWFVVVKVFRSIFRRRPGARAEFRDRRSNPYRNAAPAKHRRGSTEDKLSTKH